MVELTDEGLEAVDAAVAANTVSDRQLLDRLDPEEIAVLEGILRSSWAGSSWPTDRSPRSSRSCAPTSRTPYQPLYLTVDPCRRPWWRRACTTSSR